MKHLLFFISLIAIYIASFSCKPKDEILSGESVIHLSFSEDSVIFDTVFTGQISITKRLRVYNPYDNSINIEEIRLGGMANSKYALIINGQKTNQLNNLFLRGKDSIYILVTVHLDNTNGILPFIVTDSILFANKGNTQKVFLTSWGRNAKYYRGDSLPDGTVWDSTIAHFIYKSVIVPVNCTFTIRKGTRIYSAKGAGIHVAGTLLALGDSGQTVKFAGPRLEKYWSDIPGQWSGITFLPGSVNNRIDFAEINNVENGILIGDPGDVTTTPDLKLTNTIIKNISGSGIIAYHSKITAWNCLVTNCAVNGMALLSGGEYNFYNNTIANYEYVFRRTGVSAYFSDGTGESGSQAYSIKVALINNIIWGNLKDEIILENKGSANWQTMVMNKNIILSSDNTLTADTTNFWNKDPMFADPRNYNFSLDTLSPAIGKGAVLNLFTNDLKGKERGSSFDIGAFER